MDVRPIAIVADDSKPFLMYLARLLNRMNFEALPVTCAGEVLELSRVTRPHFITMDLMLPGMDSLEALRILRADADLSKLPVIMISSYQDKHRQWEALSLGCIDVLDKPVDLRRLHKAIQRCELYPDGHRRYLRAPFEKPVGLYHQGIRHDASSLNLSERGIFLCLHEQLPKGALVDVELPLATDEVLQVGGTVIYCKSQHDGNPPSLPGVAIKFDRVTLKNSELLSRLVAELLIGDIVNEQQEPFVSPNR